MSLCWVMTTSLWSIVSTRLLWIQKSIICRVGLTNRVQTELICSGDRTDTEVIGSNPTTFWSDGFVWNTGRSAGAPTRVHGGSPPLPTHKLGRICRAAFYTSSRKAEKWARQHKIGQKRSYVWCQNVCRRRGWRGGWRGGGRHSWWVIWSKIARLVFYSCPPNFLISIIVILSLQYPHISNRWRRKGWKNLSILAFMTCYTCYLLCYYLFISNK